MLRASRKILTNQRSAQLLQMSHIPNRRRKRSSCSALINSRSVTQLTGNERCADSERYEVNQSVVHHSDGGFGGVASDP